MGQPQIILLPKQRYFSWVRAAKDYVLHFGPNLTSDPGTAARIPGRTVTIANLPDGYGRNIVTWFSQNHPDLALDVIETEGPDDFQETLARRIRNEDQFGEGERPDNVIFNPTPTTPFRLQWPTDYAKVTQEFGRNPQIYKRFGLPGHEGIDIRAPMNANVYACADGEVYATHDGGGGHVYGLHIRIRHRDGYKTIYAHLIRILVNVGQQVRAGDLIGLADSTGNSTGSHLHLTLKKEGATAAGLTNYPSDIIDPTPFLIFPDDDTPAANDFGWPFGKSLVGLHGRADGPMQEADFELVRVGNIEAVKLVSTAPPENTDRLRQINPNMFIMVRLFAAFQNRQVSAADFANWLEHDMSRFYDRGIRYFEVHNEPNLQIEGWTHSWNDGAQFGSWLIDVVTRLKRTFPEAKFGYPGLSPGGNIDGQRFDAWTFLDQSDFAVQACDWLGVHCYWIDENDRNSRTGGQVWRGFRDRYPDKLIFITEFSNPTDHTGLRTKAEQYVRYYQELRTTPGIGGAFAFVASASAFFPHEAWRDESGALTVIPQIVGSRPAF